MQPTEGGGTRRPRVPAPEGPPRGARGGPRAAPGRRAPPRPPQPRRPPAGLASRLATYPADTVKARLHVQGAGSATLATYRGAGHAAAAILRAEGARGLYRGLGPVLAGALPGSMAYYWGYEAGRRAAPALLPAGASPAARDVATGAVAQVLAGVLFTPVDVVKERLQMHGFVRGSAGTARGVVRQVLGEGGARGLFRGYWLANSVWIPWNALYVAGYEALRRELAAATGAADPARLPAWAVALAATLAGGGAAALTAPLDVIKTRLQVGAGGRRSVAGVVRDLVRSDGALRWAWRGMGARVAHMAPGTAVSWLAYETLKARFPAGGGRAPGAEAGPP